MQNRMASCYSSSSLSIFASSAFVRPDAPTLLLSERGGQDEEGGGTETLLFRPGPRTIRNDESGADVSGRLVCH